jgi:hypothetical protein
MSTNYFTIIIGDNCYDYVFKLLFLLQLSPIIYNYDDDHNYCHQLL